MSARVDLEALIREGDVLARGGAVKPTVPEVIADFRHYHADHPAWGSLHSVLDDGNVSDDSVYFAVSYAMSTDDAEGERLARILLQMSKTQRKKIGRLV